MANPTPFTQLMAQVAKAEDNAHKHKTDAETHTQRHMEARDAERNAKTTAKHPGTNRN